MDESLIEDDRERRRLKRKLRIRTLRQMERYEDGQVGDGELPEFLHWKHYERWKALLWALAIVECLREDEKIVEYDIRARARIAAMHDTEGVG